ncbi:TIGR02569 family protein [Streptomyces sp. NPDC088910]|uniref:TIGR02569 family protein n=1 Tax=Streptomyces sp. NPDC088910 TaxID=3365911 RepID=UPI0038044489
MIESTQPAGSVPPSAAVLAAFGAPGRPVPLPGGQGQTWRDGEVVLKPTGLAAETAWRAEVLTALPASPHFRVARPVRAANGGWTAEGWEAWQYVAGRSEPGRPADVLRTAAAFHAALADVPRPGFLDTREGPWSYAARVAWEESPLDDGGGGDAEVAALIAQLAAERRPFEPSGAPAPQVVHGDLLGNVLFADGLPPAVIDWPPYWYPVDWAAAVVVVDALLWYGAGPAVLALGPAGDGCVPDPDAWAQLLVRALLFRLVTGAVLGPDAQPRPYERAAVAAVRAYVAAGGQGLGMSKK